MKLVCKMISTVDYHVFGYEITMYYYAIHWELSFVRYIGAVQWGRYGRGLAMKLAMTDRGQPPLFNAFDGKRWHQYERGVFVVKNNTQHSNIADIAVCDVARCLNTGATRPRLDV